MVGLSDGRSVGLSVGLGLVFSSSWKLRGSILSLWGCLLAHFLILGSTLGSPGLTVERFGGLLSVLGGLFGVRGCRLGANRDHFGLILGGFGFILGGFGMDFGCQNHSRFHLFFRMVFSSIFEGSRLHF